MIQSDSPLATPTFSEKSNQRLKIPAEPLAEQPVLGPETISVTLDEALCIIDDPSTTIDTLIQLLFLSNPQIVYNVCARIKQVLLVSNV